MTVTNLQRSYNVCLECIIYVVDFYFLTLKYNVYEIIVYGAHL